MSNGVESVCLTRPDLYVADYFYRMSFSLTLMIVCIFKYLNIVKLTVIIND